MTAAPKTMISELEIDTLDKQANRLASTIRYRNKVHLM